MSFDAINIPMYFLLQPELLGQQEIRNILTARFIPVDNIKQLDKEQLLSLFYRVVVPREQRPIRTNQNGSNKITSAVIDTAMPLNVNSENNVLNNGHKTVINKVQLKRAYGSDKNKNEDIPIRKKTRQRICWP